MTRTDKNKSFHKVCQAMVEFCAAYFVDQLLIVIEMNKFQEQLKKEMQFLTKV